jgi:hypothetical protein
VPGDAAAAIRGIDVTDEPQEPHQREERVASDPPGAERAVKLKAGTLLEDSLRSRRHAEFDVAVRGSDPDQGIEKRVRAHDISAISRQRAISDQLFDKVANIANFFAMSFL